MHEIVPEQQADFGWIVEDVSAFPREFEQVKQT